MKLTFFGKSDIGRVRTTNEDHFSGKMIAPDEHLFIVADGMGGHQAGEVASRLGINSFIRKYRKSRKEGSTVDQSMLKSLKQANTAILKRALSDPYKRGMGTTFTALVIRRQKACIVHIGDSRIYLIRNNKIRKLTTDHTFVEKMLKEGKITEEEARDHPQKNILYMSLGARETYFPEILKDIDMKKGDIIAMCSDGLNNMVDDETIMRYTRDHNPADSVKALIKLANRNGGTDNITIQVIQAGGPVKKTAAPSRRRERFQKTSVSLIITLMITSALLLLNSKTGGLSGNTPFSIQKSSLLNSAPARVNNTRPPRKQNLFKINVPEFPALVSGSDFLFFTRGYIITGQKNNISIYSTASQEIAYTFTLNTLERIIPSVFIHSDPALSGKPDPSRSRNLAEDLFVFRRAKILGTSYQVIKRKGDGVLLTIQSDPELNSVDHERRTVKFIKLKPPLVPVFIDKKAFMFRDQNRYYVVENPVKEKNSEIKIYRIPDISHSPDCFVSIKKIEEIIKVVFFNTGRKTIDEIEIPVSGKNRSRTIRFQLVERPLNIEYVGHDSIIIYFSNGYIDIKGNNSFVHNYYVFQNENITIQRVLHDLSSSRRILVDQYNRLFLLII